MDDRRRDGGSNSTFRTKEQGAHLTLNEHDDDDDDNDDDDKKCHKNPSNGNRVVSRGWTDGQTGMTKLIVAFRSFADLFQKVNMVVVHTAYLSI